MRYFEQRTIHQNFPVYFIGVIQVAYKRKSPPFKSDILGITSLALSIILCMFHQYNAKMLPYSLLQCMSNHQLRMNMGRICWGSTDDPPRRWRHPCSNRALIRLLRWFVVLVLVFILWFLPLPPSSSSGGGTGIVAPSSCYSWISFSSLSRSPDELPKFSAILGECWTDR